LKFRRRFPSHREESDKPPNLPDYMLQATTAKSTTHRVDKGFNVASGQISEPKSPFSVEAVLDEFMGR
jgi:hypothetical protein